MGTATATKFDELPEVEFCVGTNLGVISLRATGFSTFENTMQFYLKTEKIAAFKEWHWIARKDQLITNVLPSGS